MELLISPPRQKARRPVLTRSCCNELQLLRQEQRLHVGSSLNRSAQLYFLGSGHGSRGEGEQSAFNYGQHRCAVAAAARCSNDRRCLLGLPTMEAADAAASARGSSSLPSISLFIRNFRGELAKSCFFSSPLLLFSEPPAGERSRALI